MTSKRNASEQVAFRVEPELAGRWSAFTADSLIPNRAHLSCAMVMYMSASAAQRDFVQRGYVRFQRGGDFPVGIGANTGTDAHQCRTDLVAVAVDADEMELLEAFRQADCAARDEAIVNLLERPAATISRNADIA